MLPAHIFVEVTNSVGDVVSGEDADFLPELSYSENFKYVLKFSAETKPMAGEGSGEGSGGAPATPTIVPAAALSTISPFSSISCKYIAPNLLEITGSYKTAFDDSYQFVRKTGELVILPPYTTEPDIALIKYTMPSSSRRLFQFPINVHWPAGASWEGIALESVVLIKQWVNWSTTEASLAISKLKNLKF